MIKLNDAINYKKLLKKEKITLTNKILYFPCSSNYPKVIELNYKIYPKDIINRKYVGKGIILIPTEPERNIIDNLIYAMSDKYDLHEEILRKNKGVRYLTAKKLNRLKKIFCL